MLELMIILLTAATAFATVAIAIGVFKIADEIRRGNSHG